MIQCKPLSGHPFTPEGWEKTAQDYAKRAGCSTRNAPRFSEEQERRFKARARDDAAFARSMGVLLSANGGEGDDE